jgi:hypothetical protein
MGQKEETKNTDGAGDLTWDVRASNSIQVIQVKEGKGEVES